MEIIQSFAKFEEGSPYLTKNKSRADYVYMNFYSALLSYLTISEHYGAISMFCNYDAYDSFIKYIPYNNIIFKENDNPIEVWNKYKLDCIRTIDDDLIHVDSDVFLWDDFFTPFIEGDFDIMVQDILPANRNQTSAFGYDNKEFFRQTNILTKPYDGRCMSCGTLGLRKSAQPEYYAGIDVLYEAMLKSGLKNVESSSMIIEELLLYLIAREFEYSVHEILSPDLIKKHINALFAGTSIGYQHVWMHIKYKRNVIDYIRERVYHLYPEHYDRILKYERDVMSKFKYFQCMDYSKKY